MAVMGRGKGQEPQRHSAVVASAKRIDLSKRSEVERLRVTSGREWQKKAWLYFHRFPEVNFAYSYFANVMSRVRLFAGYSTDDTEDPSPIGDVGGISRSLVNAAKYELSRLKIMRGGQSGMLKTAALHLLVPGESFLLFHDGRWSVHSTSEITATGDQIQIRTSRNETAMQTLDTKANDVFLARVWWPDPEYSEDADSAMRSIEADADELILLQRLIRATSRSRLNAGILYVASELQFERLTDPDTTDQDVAEEPDIDPFEEELAIALTDPINNDDSPSSVLPLLVRGPSAMAENALKFLTLDRSFDKEVIERFDKTLHRVLTGLNVPREIVEGLGQSKYANGTVITEEMFRAHVEPMVAVICEALTVAYLRPQLLRRGYDETFVNNVQVWYNPAQVLIRPDRTRDADAGFDRDVLSASAWRRAHGFNDTDAPDPNDLLVKAALQRGVFSPQMTQEFMRIFAPDIYSQAEAAARSATDQMFSFPSGPPSPIPDGSNSQTQGGGGAGAAPEAPGGNVRGTNAAPAASPGPRVGGQGERGGKQDMARGIGEGLPASAMTAALTPISPKTILADAAADPQEDDKMAAKWLAALEVERKLRQRVYQLSSDAVTTALSHGGDIAATTEIIDGFGEDIMRAIQSAQKSGWQRLGLSSQFTVSPNAVQSAWRWLRTQLFNAVTFHKANPESSAQSVPMGVVRRALAIAGSEGGVPSSAATDRPDGGAVLNDRALVEVLTLPEGQPGGTTRRLMGYRWVYGISHDHFMPHYELDGATFKDWGSPDLANHSGWPPTTHYYPGDHTGCTCDYMPRIRRTEDVVAERGGEGRTIRRGKVVEPIAASSDQKSDI